ncbi:hypothetical protein BX600DRAFT_269703 [Xylariales sp. PMI_506]|nr:hypothetical protein BX600DRAFT_269703 [Xylariales sp. PMI_506]
MPSSSRHSTSTPWQDKLEEFCREYGYANPTFQLVSDRRGGRTAWSSIVTVCNQRIEARYWYDGKNTNNAKEDAAEAALIWMSGSSPASSGW